MEIRFFVDRVLARFRFGSRAKRSRRRVAFGHRLLQGNGIEIGALHDPLPASEAMRVTYVDRLDNEGLKHHYPEIPSDGLVQVEIVSDAETLQGVPDESQDFVIASHLIEHCEDPISALQAWARVLRPGGRALVVVPNKTLTFDRRRAATSWAHLERDWRDGPNGSREQHYLEWVRFVEGVSEADAEQRASELMQSRYSIHFHVWSHTSFAQFLSRATVLLDGAFSIEEIRNNGDETIAALGSNAVTPQRPSQAGRVTPDHSDEL